MTTQPTMSKSGFGFDAPLEIPGPGASGDWWGDKSFFALTRADVEEMFSLPEDVMLEIIGPFSRWSPPDHFEVD